MQAHLAETLTTLATCLKITRRDGTVYGFTSAASDLPVSSQLYKAAIGYVDGVVETAARYNVDTTVVRSVIDDDSITDADLRAGLWDYAEVRLFEVNYADLTMGIHRMRRGWLGQVTRGRYQFEAELRGLLQAVQQSIGRVYAPACNADLFDSRCGVSAGSFTLSTTVTSVTSVRVFRASAAVGAGASWYTGGRVLFTSGNNDGAAMEVKAFATATGEFELHQSMPAAIQVGDAFSVTAGCDKSLATCTSKFSNANNFRGFPHVPGIDRLMSGT